jgi:RyR domain-containing protein
MDTSPQPIYIRVVGDVIVDHHLYDFDGSVLAKSEPGGAAGLSRLLDELIQAKEKLRKEKEKKEKREREKAEKEKQALHKAQGLPPEPKAATPESKPKAPIVVELGVRPRVALVPPSHNAYAIWGTYPQDSKPDAKKVWRAARPLFYGRSAEAAATGFLLKNLERAAPSVLALDDGGFDFRQRRMEHLWNLPAAATGKPDWIVLKMSGPVVQGDLWYELTQHHREKLICIVSAKELRKEYVGIGRGTSWERTLEDLSQALGPKQPPSLLNECQHLIVTFSVDGALWISRGKKEATLVFDPERAEGEWGEARKGEAFGYLSCMAAAIAYAAAESVDSKGAEFDLAPAIGAGLAAMRDLLDRGHGFVGTPEPDGYPVKRLGEVLAQAKNDFATRKLKWPRDQTTGGAPWMMISDAPYAPDDARSVIAGLARQIVITGYGALRGAAHAKFRDLTTADRSEIEQLRDLRRLMRSYAGDDKAKKPLSIGVFGPPGAGKSFGVMQLASEVFDDKAWRDFNLSQFAGPSDLVGAFHQVRDKVLEGQTPVVFWDEFDSREYFWLQYLLAPMQDGRFQDGQLSHSIGKCVFIFAGGTSFTFDSFGPRRGDVDEAKFKLAKGPDFKSRLDGYYNVLGPNQRALPDYPDAPDPDDISYPVRRALLIRHHLAGRSPARLDIDPDLLNALLEIERYTHGARSLEKLVLPLKASGESIRSSWLPPPPRLAMHVEPSEQFYAILNRDAGAHMSEIVETLAERIHEAWRSGDYEKKPHLNVPYAQLAPIHKEDNRAAARRIPDVLGLVGLGVATAEEARSRKKPSQDQVARCIQSNIELLAEAEHDGWKAQREKNGWRFGEVRDDERKLHPLMVAYGNLPKEEQEKDRRSVRNYPAQVREAGFEIVWL